MDNNLYDGPDRIGEKTLATISNADAFNKWMYDTIKRYTSGHVLEIGSGIGNISRYFLADGMKITLSDLRDNYCKVLEEKFNSFPNLGGILKLDLTHPDFETAYSGLLGSFDSIFALNVVEHIEDHKLAIANCNKLLKTGGNIIILVPAYQWLYNGFDKGLGHYRRYTKQRLTNLIAGNDFEVIHSQYFNFFAIAGWFISGSILHKETIPEGQMKFFNRLVPVFKILDKIIFNKAGISTICVGRKIKIAD